MTDKDQQLEQFREAVERKAEQAFEGQPRHGRPADEPDTSKDGAVAAGEEQRPWQGDRGQVESMTWGSGR